MQLIRKRLTYANVMSSFAVFLVLAGGTAFAAGKLGKNSVGTKQLKNNAVTAAKIKKGAVSGAKINLSSLGTVPSATTAVTAGSANTAKTADTAKSAETAKAADTANSAKTAATAGTANTANSALTAGSAATADLARSLPALQWTEIPLGEEWETFNPEFAGAPRFTKDAEGFVNLEGAATRSVTADGSLVGTLPVGYRPPDGVWVETSATGGAFDPQMVALEIRADGEIYNYNGQGANDSFVGLTGITFYVGN